MNNLLRKRMSMFPSLGTDFENDAELFSKFGAKSEDDVKNIHYIKLHTSEIIKNILYKDLPEEQVEKIELLVFKNLDLFPINTIYKFYVAVERAIRETGIVVKKAYPLDYGSFEPLQKFDVNKWLDSTKKIYALMNNGYDFISAFNKMTLGWAETERYGFQHWLKFYRENNHMKYKKAQLFDGQDILDTGILGPVKVEPRDENKRKIRAIMSRFNSIEKMVADPNFRDYFMSIVEVPFGDWLRNLHDLKRTIQTAPIKHASSLEDIIARHANILHNQGHVNAGNLIMKIAQVEMPEEDDPFAEFTAALNGDRCDDDSLADDIEIDVDESDDDFAEDFSLKTAQQQIPPSVMAPRPIPTAQPKPAEREKKISDILDISDVKISDVIDRLDTVSSILKNREIPRQLAIVDLMMDALGIASYFPALAEATRSALESNQYMYTRIEDILSKLRGSLTPPEKVDLLISEDETYSPDVTNLKSKLEDKELKDLKIKEKRKDQREIKELLETEKEETPEELKKPIPVAPEIPPVKVPPPRPAPIPGPPPIPPRR
jgi:hypothetical protein